MGRYVRMFRNRIEKWVMFRIFQIIGGKDQRLVVFEAYGGNQNGYSCNPKALYERMLQERRYEDYSAVWAFDEPEKFAYLKEYPRTFLVKRGSYDYLKVCARAGYLFTNTGFPRYVVPSKYQKMVYLWHGKPLKCIGCSIKGNGDGKRSKKKIISDYKNAGKRLTVLLSPAPAFSDIMSDAYQLDQKKRKKAVLECGYPRNDALFHFTEADVIKRKQRIGIPLDKKVILYAPTWRPYNWQGGNQFAHEDALDYRRLYQEFGRDCVFLCRLHHLERGTFRFEEYPGFLFDVTDYPEIDDLYSVSDLLLSDYSGTIFDFANLKRPIVLYMYDKERYLYEANGLNFSLEDLPGSIATTQEEMMSALKKELVSFCYDIKYRKFNEIYNCLDGPDAANDILKAVIDT